MTKKDYELIAKSFREARGTYGVTEAHKFAKYVLDDLAKTVAIELEQDNPKFDKLKFLTACGLGSTLKLTNGHELHDPYNILSA